MIHYIGVASVISIIVPLTVAFFPKLSKAVPPALIALLLVSFISDATNCVLVYYFELKTFGVANGYAIVQYFLIAVLYYKSYSVSIGHKRFIIIGTFIFLVTTVVKFLTLAITSEYYTDLWSMSYLLIIGYSIMYLSNVFRKTPVENIVTYGQFWINAAMFYYFMLNLFFFFLAESIFHEPVESSGLLWAFHSLNNIIKNILFAVGIYYLARPRKNQVAYHSLMQAEDDSKAEEVHYAYQRRRNMSMGEADIVRRLRNSWIEDNGQINPGSSTKPGY